MSDKPIIEFNKLVSKTRFDHGCWKLDSCNVGTGYRQWRKHLAHRRSFFLFYGYLPAHLCVCHSCDQRNCINPAHLWLGTKGENLADARAKGKRLHAIGEQKANRKLSYRKVERIKKLLDNATQRQIAELFGVNPSVISRIKNNKAWMYSHVR